MTSKPIAKIDYFNQLFHYRHSDLEVRTFDVLRMCNLYHLLYDVRMLRSNVIVQGRKVWEQVPEGFPESELPLLTFLLKRERTVKEGGQAPNSDEAAAIQQEAGEGETTVENIVQSIFTPDSEGRITLAAILDYRSPARVILPSLSGVKMD